MKQMSFNMYLSIRQKLIAGWIVCIAISASFNVFSQKPETGYSGTEVCGSYILISGESNVNQFNFTYDLQNLPLIENTGEIKDTGQLELTLPIKDFKASNPLMYDDFLQLMKASEYPRITIGIPKNQLYFSGKELYSICPEMKITIAGITRYYKIDCSVINCSENLFLVGSQKIKLTDFKLNPPEKIYGLVKVNNEIRVNFSFIITFTDGNLIARLP